MRLSRTLSGVATGAGVAVLVGVPCAALAASLPIVAAQASGSSAVVSGCDRTTAYTLSYVEDSTGHVTSTTVSGISAACNGATLYLTLVKGTTVAGVGSGGVQIANGTATVSIPSAPLYSAVDTADIAIVGP